MPTDRVIRPNVILFGQFGGQQINEREFGTLASLPPRFIRLLNVHIIVGMLVRPKQNIRRLFCSICNKPRTLIDHLNPILLNRVSQGCALVTFLF